MQYKLNNLLAVVSALCIAFALSTYAAATRMILGGLLGLLLWELIQFAQDLKQSN